MAAEQLLPPSVLRNVGDKLYEKRKAAALEVEQVVKTLAAGGDTARVGAILEKLAREFAASPQANHRKGGLLCLAAAAVGLDDCDKGAEFLPLIVPSVLNSFTDADSRVRYYACEALYNIAKVSREAFVPFFPEVFEGVFKLSGDADRSVREAAGFLDNLVKDIVTASPQFDVHPFIPALRQYLTVENPYKRQFLVDWVTVLASVPDIDMLAYLPDLLGGLLGMLRDDHREIRQAASKALQEFLVELQSTQAADYGALAPVLAAAAAGAENITARATAMRWLRTFVGCGKPALVPHYALVLAAVLPGLSHTEPDIAQAARQANAELLDMPEAGPGGERIDTAALLDAVSGQLNSPAEPTRLAALHWVNTLLARSRPEVLGRLSVLIPALLEAVTAGSERVAAEALAVLAAIAAEPEHFQPLLAQLLDMFRGPKGMQLLQARGTLVVRRLAALLGGQTVLAALAGLLEGEADLRFAATMAQALNLILLTAPELRELRALLQSGTASPEGARMFVALYRSWCHSAGAALSLCFLAQAYAHAGDLVFSFARLPLGVEVLVQIDRLVQLLETPAFTFLRLQLLQPAQYPALIRSMYGLLMLLPQSDAFKTLHARLHSVPTMALLKLDSPSSLPEASAAGDAPAAQSPRTRTPRDSTPAQQSGIDFGALLQLFRQRQEEHAAVEQQQQRQSLGSEAAGGSGRPAAAGWELVDGQAGLAGAGQRLAEDAVQRLSLG